MKTYQQLWQSLTPLYETGEAQAIVRTVLDVKYGMTLTDIICGKVNELSVDEERNLEEIVERLQNGEPVQYVLGKADFAGRTFHVEPGVLIPRPETAELCEWMAKSASPQPRIMDLCTGSGCIAITLSFEIPNSEVLGIDISDCACRIATENAKLLSSKACFEKMGIASEEAQKGLEEFNSVSLSKKNAQNGELGNWTYSYGNSENQIVSLVDSDHDDNYVNFYKKSKGNN